jgi:hypothetical protein
MDVTLIIAQFSLECSKAEVRSLMATESTNGAVGGLWRCVKIINAMRDACSTPVVDSDRD